MRYDVLVLGGGSAGCVLVTVAILQPESRGYVRLRSPDPAVSPEIEHRI